MNNKQRYAIKARNEQTIKKLCPKAQHHSGIYCFHREDEYGFRYAYVGLATRSVLSRCADHLSGFQQHIDLSIKAHKLYSKENPYGWKLDILCYCSPEECNEKEQYYIKKVHNSARQLLNVTGGSQGEGKFNIGQNKSAKGYRQGLHQGYKNAQKFVANLFDKHLKVIYQKGIPNKNAEKAMEKFIDFLDYEETSHNSNEDNAE